MKASAYIAAFLADQGVTTVFELTGGMITHLLDSLYERGDIRIVSMHHEQAAAFAAEGGARMTGVPGVALATSGPGATNLITGIGSCYFDSVPTVFITGQVNTHELRADSGVRQAGFQETDIVEIAKPIAKAAWQVSSAAELPDALATAFRIALEGRPGPVLLDVPMDVQRQDVVASPAGVVAPKRLEPGDIGPVVAALSAADRPLILAGGGVRTSGGAGLLRDFAQATRIPVVSTLMGLDVLPSGHALRVGLIGTYGNRWANLALGDADCILALGARLDIRQTGADVSAFAEGKRIIKVDVDERQLAWRIPADIAVQADLAAFLEAARAAATTVEWRDTSAWLDRIGEYEAQWPDAAELAGLSGIKPADVVRELSEAIPEASAFVADVGQNQMWAAQSLRLGEGQRFMTSGGMGSMGFALPAAIGAALSAPGAPVVVIAGDGGMQCNIQELETVARLRLPLKIVVLDNGCLGMVRQFQDENFNARYQSTLWGYGSPDFVAVSEAYGIAARRVEEPSALGEAISWLVSERAAPALLEVKLDPETRVRPKVPFGNAVYVMDPPDGG